MIIWINAATCWRFMKYSSSTSKHWQTLDAQINLDELKNTAWKLHDTLFKNNSGSMEWITLRLLIRTTYDDKDKESFDQSLDFYDCLMTQAEELNSYSIFKPK